MTLEQLKKVLDHHFGPPFLPEGYVRAEIVAILGEPTLQVNIGRRDIWVTENGRVTGAGTCCTEKATDSDGRAVRILQDWIVRHHCGEFDITRPENVARAMIALTHEAPMQGDAETEAADDR
jgi:hypothetical protein